MTRSGRKKQKQREQTEPNIRELLHQFQESSSDVYTFDENLTKLQRAEVHQCCRKFGMTSKSYGGEKRRRVSVYKSKKLGGIMTGKEGSTKIKKKGSAKIKKKGSATIKKEKLTSLIFSEEAKAVLLDLFECYPPDGELLGKNVIREDGGNGKNDKLPEKKDDLFCKPSLNKEEIAKKLKLVNSRMGKAPYLRQIIQAQSKLPIASFKDAITSSIDSHRVVLVSGETGCGKTTQVPQYILEHMWGKGEICKIVCTQPRRISATSVAERVSYERGEALGENIGYKIRLESKGGQHSSIVFCTNGVLLRMLVSKGISRKKTETSNKQAKGNISGITHIIVDEIHERDHYSDFMLAILRDILPFYPHLHLILMSATLDAEKFSKYFGGCPIIRVPGFTHPVKTFYLEDVLSILKSTESNHLDSTSSSVSTKEPELTEEYKVALDEALSLAWENDEFGPLLDFVSSDGTGKVLNYQHSFTGLSPLMVFAGKGRVGDVITLLSLGVDCQLQANDGTTVLQLAEKETQGEVAQIIREHISSALPRSLEEQQLLDNYLATTNQSFIDVVLIEQLLRKICSDSKDGAVLIFLSGWDDIKRTRQRILSTSFFQDSSKFMIISLHSMVPSMEQKKVFSRPPRGCRKIILSTNIAETAITIDDVVYVIDGGRMKEKSYDPYNNMSIFQSSWISKASARQREGRAGRCQPGICYHLYSRFRAASLPDYQVPEIQRMPVEELCLQVKMMDPHSEVEVFLNKTLDPPAFETIQNAVHVLQEIGALALDGKLTKLGEKLGLLPVHPLASRMIFVAILLNCLDPALTLACASEYRDPFTLPMLPAEKKKAADAKAELASLYGGLSDQLAVVAAFDCWRSAKAKGQEAKFCSKYFVSASTMKMLSGMRRQLQSELIRYGFISDDASSCSLHAKDPGILNALLVAGLYPMVGRFLPPTNGRSFVVKTSSGDKARLHYQSINLKVFSKKPNNRPLIVFDEVTQGDGGKHIRNSTVVGPLPLALLAAEIVVAPPAADGSEVGDKDADIANMNEGGEQMHGEPGDQSGEKLMSSPNNGVIFVIDRWLSFESTALDVAQIYCLRERLSAAILFKVTHPRKALPPVLDSSMQAIARILSYDGLSGISQLFKSVDRLASMVDATEIDNSADKEEVMDHQNGFLESLMIPEANQHPLYYQYKSMPLAFMGTATRTGASNNIAILPFTSAGVIPYPRPLAESDLAGNGLGGPGKRGPKRSSMKRRHGNRAGRQS